MTALAKRVQPVVAELEEHSAGASSVGSRLTRREREVARLLAAGLSNRQIAEQLFVSERTAETHVQNILMKLGFGSRTQVAAWAVREGLTEPAT